MQMFKVIGADVHNFKSTEFIDLILLGRCAVDEWPPLNVLINTFFFVKIFVTLHKHMTRLDLLNFERLEIVFEGFYSCALTLALSQAGHVSFTSFPEP